MAATLFSNSFAPQFLSLSAKPTPAASAAAFPSGPPQLRALAAAAAGWRSLATVRAAAAVAMAQEVEAEGQAEEFSEDLRVFVGILPFSVDSAQLAGLFEQAGSVEMVEVIYDKLTGRSRGFGFVTMSSVEEAGAAVEQFNGYSRGTISQHPHHGAGNLYSTESLSLRKVYAAREATDQHHGET